MLFFTAAAWSITGKKKKYRVLCFLTPMPTAWQKLCSSYKQETNRLANDAALKYSEDLINRLNGFEPRSATSVPNGWKSILEEMKNQVAKRNERREVPQNIIIQAFLCLTEAAGFRGWRK